MNKDSLNNVVDFLHALLGFVWSRSLTVSKAGPSSRRNRCQVKQVVFLRHPKSVVIEWRGKDIYSVCVCVHACVSPVCSKI